MMFYLHLVEYKRTAKEVSTLSKCNTPYRVYMYAMSNLLTLLHFVLFIVPMSRTESTTNYVKNT